MNSMSRPAGQKTKRQESPDADHCRTVLAVSAAGGNVFGSPSALTGPGGIKKTKMRKPKQGQARPVTPGARLHLGHSGAKAASAA